MENPVCLPDFSIAAINSRAPTEVVFANA